MAIQLISGATNDIATIDPTSKALRTTLYGPDGQPLRYNSGVDRFVADIRVKATSTATTGVVWSIKSVTSGKVVYITKFVLQAGFNGTGAATEQQWELVKGTGATAYGSSPTTVTPLLKRTALSNPDVEVRVLDTTFTLTSASFGSAFCNIYGTRVTHSATQAGQFVSPAVIDFGEFPIELAQNEFIAIRSVNTQVVGDILAGCVEGYGG